jgi:hypothetical protein
VKRTATAFGKQARSDRQRQFPRDVARAYLGAIGGAVAAAARAQAAQRGATNAAGFLSYAAGAGLGDALDRSGLTGLRDRPAPEVLSALVDQLVGDGALLEEAAARDALAEVLTDLFGDADTYEELEQLFAEVNADRVAELIQRFIARYIYIRMLQELLANIERGARTIEQAERARRDLRDFIDAWVVITIGDRDPLTIDWTGDEGRTVVTALLQAAYEALQR